MQRQEAPGSLQISAFSTAEMEFEERKSEPVIVFITDKTSTGAWNFALYKIFADPFNTAGLVIDSSMHDGFKFEILDVIKEENIVFNIPEEMYDILVFIGARERYLTRKVWRKSDNEIAAVSSTQKLEGRFKKEK